MTTTAQQQLHYYLYAHCSLKNREEGARTDDTYVFGQRVILIATINTVVVNVDYVLPRLVPHHACIICTRSIGLDLYIVYLDHIFNTIPAF